MTHPYLALTEDDREEMLRTIGVSEVETLLERIPSKARLGRELAIPPALAEAELTAHIRALADENAHAGALVSFLGGGVSLATSTAFAPGALAACHRCLEQTLERRLHGG